MNLAPWVPLYIMYGSVRSCKMALLLYESL